MWKRSMELGRSTLAQGKPGEAEKAFRIALREAEKFGEDNRRVEETLVELASVYQQQSRYAEATPVLHRLLNIRQKKSGGNHRTLIGERNNLAQLYYALGDVQTADSIIRSALIIGEDVLREDDPQLATTLEIYAGITHDGRDYAEAEKLYLRALEIKENKYGPKSRQLLRTINGLAVLYQEQKRFDDAEKQYLRAISITEENQESNHSRTIDIYLNLAGMYNENNDLDNAILFYKRALQILTRYQARNFSKIINTNSDLAGVYEKNNDIEAAKKHYRDALDLIEKAPGSRRLIPDLEGYIRVLEKSGDTVEAGKYRKILADASVVN